MKYKLITTLLLLISFQLQALKLKDSFANAHAGDYFVTQQGKTYTLLLVRDNTYPRLVLEEVTIPKAQFLEQNLPIREWVQKGCPGHTLWTISQIHLDKGNFEECYSFTHRGWLDLTGTTSFLTTLLNLDFQQIPDSQRQKIGFPPKHGYEDKRPFWSPPLIANGEKHHLPCRAYFTRWPSDHTEMSRHRIEVYLPQSETTQIHAYFPYWIEVDGKITKVQTRVIDSGSELSSPQHDLPYRPPTITSVAYDVDQGLLIGVKSPAYFKSFHLIAESQDAFFSPPIFLNFEQHALSDGTLEISIPYGSLENQLGQGENYQITLSPQESPSLSVTVGNSLVINNFR